MADGKPILIFIVTCSLLSFVFGSLLLGFGSGVGEDLISNSIILSQFYDVDPAQDITSRQGIEFNGTFTDNINDMTTATGGGQATSTIVAVFLDPLKMPLAILSYMTPVPIIDFFNALGMPYWLNLLIAIPISLAYILSIFEFIRGVIF